MSETQYIVSARKYRPATFRSVVGQANLTSTLKNAIEQQRLAQAYLFTGPRGVGKTSCARIFAKTINCMNRTPEGEACGVCESCRSIDEGNSFNIIELDAASNNSVNDIRSITEQVNVPPQTGRYRVFIIDEVHMLSSGAFNAFLKTLEEPPEYVIFILATTEKHKVLPTILSRCQIYDFKRITVKDITEHLKYVAETEGFRAEESALGVIARKADGAMRDALSIFDQVAASTRGNITYEATTANLNVLDYDTYFRIIDCFRNTDAPGALLIYKEVRDRGFDSLFFVNGLAQHIRDLMVAADPRTLPLLEVTDDVAERFKQQAGAFVPQWYYAAMKLLGDCDLNYRTATNKQLLVELTLIRLSQLLKPTRPPFDSVDYTPPMRSPQPPTAPQPASASPASPASASPPSSPASASPSPGSSSPSSPASTSPSSPFFEKAPSFSEGPKATAPKASSSSLASPAPASPPSSAASASPSPGSSSPSSPASASSSSPLFEKAPSFSEGPKSPRPAVRLSSPRLSEMRKMAVADSFTIRETPVDEQRFQKAWSNFINQNGELHILTSAMRHARPRRSGPAEFTVTVGHPAQQQAFESSMPKLLEALRNELENDMVTIKVEIDTTKEVSRILPPQEFLRKAVEINPALGDFLTAINAEL